MKNKIIELIGTWLMLLIFYFVVRESPIEYAALIGIVYTAIISSVNYGLVSLFNYFKTQKAKFSKHNLHTEYCSGDKNGKIEVFGENLNIDVKKNAKRILIGIGGVLIAIAIVRLILGLIAESVLL